MGSTTTRCAIVCFSYIYGHVSFFFEFKQTVPYAAEIPVRTGCFLERFIERRHLVPEIGLAAADARMTRLYWPARTIVKLHPGTVIVRFRTLAAYLEEAESGLLFLGAKGRHEFTGFVVRAAGAGIMNGLPVSEEGPFLAVQIGEFSEQEIVHDCSNEADGVWRTAGNFNHGSL